MSKRKIIIDCDLGNGIAGSNVDDGLALAVALGSENIDLKAITTVSGNTKNYMAYKATKEFLKNTKYDIEVYCGSPEALIENPKPWREFLDNNVKKSPLFSLWDKKEQFDFDENTEVNAIENMARIIKENPHQITLIGIGPLTNIALLLKTYPWCESLIEEIVLMGGSFNVPFYLKDTNFGIDPEAAYIVLNSKVKVTIAPYDVTTTTMLLHQDLDEIATYNNKLSNYLVKTTRPWLEYSRETRQIPGCWVHDVLTVLYLIDKDLFSYRQANVNIELSGAFRGRTYYANLAKNTFDIKLQNEKQTNVITKVNNDLVIKAIKESLKKAF